MPAAHRAGARRRQEKHPCCCRPLFGISAPSLLRLMSAVKIPCNDGSGGRRSLDVALWRSRRLHGGRPQAGAARLRRDLRGRARPLLGERYVLLRIRRDRRASIRYPVRRSCAGERRRDEECTCSSGPEQQAVASCRVATCKGRYRTHVGEIGSADF
jgi:hypothetical protein